MKKAFLPLKLSQLRINSRGWLSVAVIIAVTIMLSISLVRVVVDAQSNYQVYLDEQEALEEHRELNAYLKSQQEYYKSYEFKKLYARDYLHLGEAGERLYRVAGQNTYYAVEQEDVDLFADTPPITLWGLLI